MYKDTDKGIGINIYVWESLPVILSPRWFKSELVFVYENPTPTGDSTNNKLASEMKKIKEGVRTIFHFFPKGCVVWNQNTPISIFWILIIQVEKRKQKSPPLLPCNYMNPNIPAFLYI